MDKPAINELTRRQALKSAGAVVGAAAMTAPARAQRAEPSRKNRPMLCLFSKALHSYPFAELPEVATKLGLDALDLTCRPEGHVLPERVADDLPRAHELLKSAGIGIPMVTTSVTDADKGNAEAIIKTAAGLGIRYAKLGYYPYGDLRKIHGTLADVKARLRDVAALCKQYGVRAGFHNHSGNTVGAAMWDVWHLIHDLDADAIGSYFDVGHATVEGGYGGWRIGLNLLMPRIIMVAVKDMAYRKDPERGWRPHWGPLGQGMVRFTETFKRLKEQGFAGPVALHKEYGHYAAPIGSKQDQENLTEVRQDIVFMVNVLKKAGLT